MIVQAGLPNRIAAVLAAALAVVVFAGLLVAAAAAPAQAATVRIETDVDETEDPPIVTTVALDADGNRFRGRITRSGDRYAVVSRAGAVTAGQGCRRTSRRRAVCESPRPIDFVVAALSPRDDELTVATGRLGAVGVSVDGGAGKDLIRGPSYRNPAEGGAGLSGGAGRDTLVGGNGADAIGGGPGRDRLLGRGGRDRLVDNGGPRRSNRDTLDGGSGRDTVSYEGRGRGVRVDLARRRAGRGRELDRLRRIESAYGSEGNDLLLGSRRANVLSGGQGADTLRGGRGGDLLEGGASFGVADRFSGGPGADRLRTADEEFQVVAEPVACGTGNDLVLDSNLVDRMRGDCERALLSDGLCENGGAITINPRVEGRRATFRLSCARPPGARCQGAIAINDESTDFDVPPGEWEIPARLSAADGQRLAANGTLAARVDVRGDDRAQFTTTLR